VIRARPELARRPCGQAVGADLAPARRVRHASSTPALLHGRAGGAARQTHVSASPCAYSASACFYTTFYCGPPGPPSVSWPSHHDQGKKLHVTPDLRFARPGSITSALLEERRQPLRPPPDVWRARCIQCTYKGAHSSELTGAMACSLRAGCECDAPAGPCFMGSDSARCESHRMGEGGLDVDA
jgi:hypothetical protein